MDAYKLVDIMSTDILYVKPQSPLDEVTRLMSQQRYSCLLVVENNKPIGIITERDIVNLLAEKLNAKSICNELSNDIFAENIMSKNLIALTEEQDILDALVVSNVNKIRHIPIISKKGILLGLVTYTDIANVQRDMIESYSAIVEKGISARTSELEEANNLLKEMTLLDPLLGIGNRRAMEIDVKSTHSVSKRYKESYAIAMIDIDYFKLYNDFYGHQMGDDTLRQVTNSIKSSIRTTDRLYRYGGEEFLLLMPHTEELGAIELLHRIVLNVQSEKIPHCKSQFEVVTVSAGLSLYGRESNAMDLKCQSIVKQADEALYKAKSSGRNQIATYHV